MSPKCESWWPIEFPRQIMYFQKALHLDRELCIRGAAPIQSWQELVKFNIIDVVMVSAMGPPGGGRTFITERLKRHYSTLAYSDLSDVSIKHIFAVITKHFFAVFDSSVQEVVPKMIDCTINVFKQAQPAQQAAMIWKKVREAMEADGVHPNFLQDAHWVQLWRKHFEGSALLDPEVPFERPMEETPLGDEAGIDPVMTDLRTAAKLSSQGYRSFVWRQGEDGSDQIHWEEFARMACNMVLAMKGLPPSQKEERGLDLKKRYNPDQEGPNSGQLTVNEKAVVGPEHRLLRVDNFAFLAHELQKLGYACSSVGAKDYVPLKDRTGSYGERLAQSEWSFAPKSGVKRGKSTARHFLEKRVKDGGHKATIDGHQWPIDDDGQAIFWRNDRFEIVGEPEFLVLPGDADIDAFLDGTSEEPGAGDAVQAVMGVLWESHGCTQSDQGAVRVLLQFKDLDERLHRQQFYPIRSMDANTEVDFEDPDMTCSSVPIPEDANALQSFMQKNDLRSVWDSFYSSKGDIWDPPVSVWKMRGSASAQPKKDPADRDWLALMPNELLPSDHLPIVWDFHLNVNSPRWEPTVLVSCAKQLFQQLRSLLPGADPNLDEIESLFAPLYLGGLHGRRDSSPDVALSVFHVLKKISVEAKATLKYELTDNVSKLELFRERSWSDSDGLLPRIIKATGRHQSKATYESSLVQALLFSAASIVAGQGGLFSDQWSTIALAAMRCVLRTLTAVPCLDPSFVEVMSEGQLWALLAQMTSIITPNCPYIVKAFDQNGIVTSQDMDCLLVEIGEQLNCRRTPCAPALCVLRCINWRKCATGTHVAAAVKMLMQAIEAGKIPFLEQHLFGPTDRMEEMQAVPSAVSVVSTIRVLVKIYLFEGRPVHGAEAVAKDSGGGLALLLESLQRQMALAQGTSTPERQARALHRPPPWVVASYVRRTVVSALEKTEPLEALVVSAQKLHVSEQEAKKRARLNPVEELIQALVDFPQDGPQSQAHTFGRILRLLVKIADRCGPKALLAPMVARSRGGDPVFALLSEEDLQRWKTHLHLNRFLDLLLSVDVSSDSLLLALQQRVEEAIKDQQHS
eukprot:g32202.t1